MSRRDELKRKQQLQLLFQQAMQQSQSRIVLWIGGELPTKAGPKSGALDLPVVEPGKSLSTLNLQLQSVDQFLNGAKPRPKPTSRSLSALQHKITKSNTQGNGSQANAKTQRGKNPATIRNNNRKSPAAYAKTTAHADSDSESDSDTPQKLTAKKPKLLF